MTVLVHELILEAAHRRPEAEALAHDGRRLSYEALSMQVQRFAGALLAAGLEKGERAAVYLDKRMEAVAALFGTAAAGGVFVPVNPLLKPEQVAYILRDCNVRVLFTSAERLQALQALLPRCPELHTIVVAGPMREEEAPLGVRVLQWEDFIGSHGSLRGHRVIDRDMAAILYTSGSTGHPKGVILSHGNLVAGAQSVAQYLGNTAEDRILSVLPLSFDYGLSQLTTAFHSGACAVLFNYLLPSDLVRTVENERITGLAGVPSLWIQLAQQRWPQETSLRYLTNSGGALPRPSLAALRHVLPQTKVFLMYGLTEAFRSTYLPPQELERRPGSIGRAIPNAEVLVLREDGTPCEPGEPGELVHRGALVAQGYWNAPDKTAERFRPLPARNAGLPLTEIAVWSGDIVYADEEGFLYFIGRHDDMIKVSGYRVSPTEIEEVIHATGLVSEVAAFGIPHPALGQAVVVVAVAKPNTELSSSALVEACRERLPLYMVPAHVAVRSDPLPRNPNGKPDRTLLRAEFDTLFTGEERNR
ncbi:acyl-CoA ligase (AMP-forming), exosortase A system-associated [Noviherbaspirillum massiliense]|uniref:acyl-CoA ligase (AMP-forming), exosortase A system-associated n=1 Tax=Noviherbaspirillum massiliense TaxID=1465823 RepID=UPI0003727F9A|nr:acyl-CoA ligase (AMP-forming), exosortase A system-associated [Noviherbaspirillum massiliense]